MSRSRKENLGHLALTFDLVPPAERISPDPLWVDAMAGWKRPGGGGGRSAPGVGGELTGRACGAGRPLFGWLHN